MANIIEVTNPNSGPTKVLGTDIRIRNSSQTQALIEADLGLQKKEFWQWLRPQMNWLPPLQICGRGKEAKARKLSPYITTILIMISDEREVSNLIFWKEILLK